MTGEPDPLEELFDDSPDYDPGTTYIIVDREPLTGAYFPAIVLGERTWAVADPVAYARRLIEATEHALHDASVADLLVHRLHQPVQYAAWFVGEMRKDRPPPDHTPTLPLVFEPQVASKTGLPWVTLQLDGEDIGRWTPTDARGHAAHVLGSPVAAELDTALVRQLRAGFEMSPEAAASFVHDLRHHRQDDHKGGDGDTKGSR